MGRKNPPATPSPAGIARIVHLPPDGVGGDVGLLCEDRLEMVPLPPERLAGLVEGDLVSVHRGTGGLVSRLERVGGALPGAWAGGVGDPLRWRPPTGNTPSRMAFLRLRQSVLQEIRAWLDGQGFLEVDTPVLVPAPSPEAVFTPLPAGGGYLITSPEFQLKRMLVGGFPALYRLGPVFRGAEIGAQHNPEFSMLEWYRAGAGLPDLATDLATLLKRLVPLAEESARQWEALGGTGDGAAATRAQAARLRERARLMDGGQIPQVSVAALFRQHLGMDIGGVTDVAGLRAAASRARRAAASLPGDFTGVFSALWVEVEEHLTPAPLLVVDWPAPTASLARLKPEDPTLAERMELYAGGMELANGFAELTDAAEQRRRFLADLAGRRAQGLPPLPLDEAFLRALEQGLPPAAGMALGVDRLVMLVTGAPAIGSVLPFAWNER